MSAVRTVVVHPDADALAVTTGARLLLQVLDAQAVRAPVHVVLTGGTVGIRLLAEAARNPLRDLVDWSDVHVWWGDERFVGASDADRNALQARTALLDSLPLPPGNVHEMPAARPEDPSFGPDEAAAEHAAELARYAPEGAATPVFDVVLLGMGPDMHVASLFPGHPARDAVGTPTVGVHDSPKPPPSRVSLTFEAINGAREVWVVAAGAEKADAVAAGLAGDPESSAAHVHGTERTLWLVDAAAAGTAATDA
ncbi:6-phosphogluconolactonase [Sanguibacter sp. HDW7]|uniref:6-phosphogluconolactonase n=1 Tax=Sanguibacter sp. HDW7 TaxID=2714931 RepID=UPI001409BA7E|nr:6-phosphogluconolactonase [Sanguibacter sp. HDW7]QIK83473.1 6-phosphogluconolactonase [Sanguibacter sp. HDW7]